ncbi:MAG: hypothetical protein Q4E76_04500 [Tissierellia bacterium]|nr:hypothetical protein [Tissierellia bacterium]
MKKQILTLTGAMVLLGGLTLPAYAQEVATPRRENCPCYQEGMEIPGVFRNNSGERAQGRRNGGAREAGSEAQAPIRSQKRDGTGAGPVRQEKGKDQGQGRGRGERGAQAGKDGEATRARGQRAAKGNANGPQEMRGRREGKNLGQCDPNTRESRRENNRAQKFQNQK